MTSRPLRWLARILAGLVATAAFLWWGLPLLLTPAPYGPAIAPDPGEHRDAVIQVYGANVIGVRGRYAIHTWIATKPSAADDYRIYEVIGWRLRRNGTALSVSTGNPARRWFGAPPILLHEQRGPAVDALIDRVHDAIDEYPYAREYTMWPGPNSNSFIAWVGLAVPELDLQLPAKAIGQNWMVQNFDAALRNREPPTSDERPSG